MPNMQGEMKESIMPLSPGVKFGGKSLEDLLGSILETPGKKLGPMRLTSFNPEEETLRLHGVKTGQPIETNPDDFAKLLHSGDVERQGAAMNQGLTLQQLVGKLGRMLK